MTPNPTSTTETTEDRVLIVLDRNNPTATLRAALRDSDPGETTFHLVMVVPTKSYEERRRAFAKAGVPKRYTIGQATENARQRAQRIGREFLGHDANGFQASGAVGRQRDQVRSIVDKHEFQTVYVPEQNRSILERFLPGGYRAKDTARELPDGVSVEIVEVDGVQSGREGGQHPTVETGDLTRKSN